MVDQVGFRTALLTIGARADFPVTTRVSALALLKRITNAYWTASSHSNRSTEEQDARKMEREDIQNNIMSLIFEASPNMVAELMTDVVANMISGSIAEQWPTLFPQLIELVQNTTLTLEQTLESHGNGAWEVVESSTSFTTIIRACSLFSACIAPLPRYALRGGNILKEVVAHGLPPAVHLLRTSFRIFLSSTEAMQRFEAEKAQPDERYYEKVYKLTDLVVRIAKLIYGMVGSKNAGKQLFYVRVGQGEGAELLANILFGFIREALPLLDSMVAEPIFPLAGTGLDILKAISHARGSMASIVLEGIRASPMLFGHYLLPFLDLFTTTIEHRAKTRDARAMKELVHELYNNTPAHLRDQISGESEAALAELRAAGIQAQNQAEEEDPYSDPDNAASELMDALQSMDAEDNRCAKGTDMCTLQALHFVTFVLNCLDYARALGDDSKNAEPRVEQTEFLSARLQLAAKLESKADDGIEYDPENVAAVENALRTFFTPERIASLAETLLSSFMALTLAQREHWCSDPEDFIQTVQAGDFDEQSQAASLLAGLSARMPEIVQGKLIEKFNALVADEDATGGPAAALQNYEAFIAADARENLLTTTPQAAMIRLQLDGILLALSQELHAFREQEALNDLFSYVCSRVSQTMMATQTLTERGANGARILTVSQTPITTTGLYRALAFLEKFVRSATDFITQDEDGMALLSLIGALQQSFESSDTVIRRTFVVVLEAVLSMQDLADALSVHFANSPELVKSLIEAVCSLVFDFKDVVLKSQALKCLNQLVIVLDTSIIDYSEIITNFIPELWAMCRDPRMQSLKITLTDILGNSVQGLRGYSEQLQEPVLFPLIASGLGLTEEPSDGTLHDDILQLWAIVVENTVTLSDGLLELFSYIDIYLSSRADNIEILMRILIAYARLDATRILQARGPQLAQSLLRVLIQECQTDEGIIREKSLGAFGSVLVALEEMCPLEPQLFTEYFGDFLILSIQHARTFALFGTESPLTLPERQLKRILSYICYVLVRAPAIGLRFLQSLTSGMKVDPTRPDVGDSSEVPQLIFATLLQVMPANEIPYYRKLVSMAAINAGPLLTSLAQQHELFYLYNTVLLADPAVTDSIEHPGEVEEYLRTDQYRMDVNYTLDPVYTQSFADFIVASFEGQDVRQILEGCEPYRVDRLVAVLGFGE